MMRSTGFVLEPGMSLGCPAFKHFIDTVSRRLQIGTDCTNRPTLRMQIDNRPPSLVPISDLCIGRISSRAHPGFGTIGEDSLDGVRRGPAPKAQKTDGGDFIGAKAWVRDGGRLSICMRRVG